MVYWLLLSGELFSSKLPPPALSKLNIYLLKHILIYAALENNVPVMDWWLNVSLHGVSFFLMITEVIFGRMQMHARMVLPVFCLVLVYMLLTFIIYGS